MPKQIRHVLYFQGACSLPLTALRQSPNKVTRSIKGRVAAAELPRLYYAETTNLIELEGRRSRFDLTLSFGEQVRTPADFYARVVRVLESLPEGLQASFSCTRFFKNVTDTNNALASSSTEFAIPELAPATAV